MSAYVVDREHVAYLVCAARCVDTMCGFHWRTPGGEWIDIRTPGTALLAGQMLWEECIRSVLARYPGDTRESMPGPVGEDFILTEEDIPARHRPIKPVEVLKAINAYEYQACEHEQWEHSEAHSFCAALRDAAIRNLPGYEEAAWSAPENWQGQYSMVR